jgi:hypothetical protein
MWHKPEEGLRLVKNVPSNGTDKAVKYQKISNLKSATKYKVAQLFWNPDTKRGFIQTYLWDFFHNFLRNEPNT